MPFHLSWNWQNSRTDWWICDWNWEKLRKSIGNGNFLKYRCKHWRVSDGILMRDRRTLLFNVFHTPNTLSNKIDKFVCVLDISAVSNPSFSWRHFLQRGESVPNCMQDCRQEVSLFKRLWSWWRESCFLYTFCSSKSLLKSDCKLALSLLPPSSWSISCCFRSPFVSSMRQGHFLYPFPQSNSLSRNRKIRTWLLKLFPLREPPLMTKTE